MINLLEIIEAVERADVVEQKELDLMDIIEAIERSGPNNPIPRAVLGKIIGDAVADPACPVNREDECSILTESRQSWSPVSLYCWQVSEGPRLTVKRDLTKDNLPADWFEQHIRSMSSSVLDRIYEKEVKLTKAGQPVEPLPLLEAKRIIKILRERLDKPETTEQEKAFVRSAIERGVKYVEEWNLKTKMMRK